MAPGSCLTGYCPVRPACPWNTAVSGDRQKVLEQGGGSVGLRLELSAAWGAAAAPRVSFGVPFGSDCLAQGGAMNSARTRVPGLGMKDPSLPSQIGPGLLTPPSPPWLVSGALNQERGGVNLHIFGRPPYSFPQHKLASLRMDGDG